MQESRIFHPQANSSFEDLDSTDVWDVLQDVQRDTNTIPLTSKIDVFPLRGPPAYYTSIGLGTSRGTPHQNQHIGSSPIGLSLSGGHFDTVLGAGLCHVCEKNWPKAFEKRHPELNETTYKGAGVKRTMVTAIECISADGRSLPPLIIWPASTHRSNWTTYPTPGWHYACSESGYTDSKISLEWLKRVFDPQTKARAHQKPRILICDGFGTHETLEILEYCFKQHPPVSYPLSHLPQAPAL